MEALTFGQAIDILQMDEVALKVDGLYDITYYQKEKNTFHHSLQIGFHFDENDGNLLKSLTNNREISIVHNPELEEKEKYVIIKREAYEKMKKEMRQL